VAANLLRLGATAQVVEPPEFVEHVAATVEAMARLFPRA
jgi:hypothetical protein